MNSDKGRNRNGAHAINSQRITGKQLKNMTLLNIRELNHSSLICISTLIARLMSLM